MYTITKQHNLVQFIGGLSILIAGLLLVTYQTNAGLTYEYGDAPDGRSVHGPMNTYESDIPAKFPTIYEVGGTEPGLMPGPYHHSVAVAHLGHIVDYENDVLQSNPVLNTTNLNPSQNLADLDGSSDDAVPSIPDHGLVPSEVAFWEGLENSCATVPLWVTVTIADPPPSEPLYINMWFDFNRDGDWEDSSEYYCFGDGRNSVRREWAVQEYELPSLGPGTYHIDISDVHLPYIDYSEHKAPMWMRVTLSPERANIQQPFDGSGPYGGYAFGETEDYLLEYKEWDGGSEPQAGWSG